MRKLEVELIKEALKQQQEQKARMCQQLTYHTQYVFPFNSSFQIMILKLSRTTAEEHKINEKNRSEMIKIDC